MGAATAAAIVTAATVEDGAMTVTVGMSLPGSSVSRSGNQLLVIKTAPAGEPCEMGPKNLRGDGSTVHLGQATVHRSRR